MPVERLIKRITFKATCEKCGNVKLREDKPPRNSLCECGDWMEWKEVSAIGPDLGLPGYK